MAEATARGLARTFEQPEARASLPPRGKASVGRREEERDRLNRWRRRKSRSVANPDSGGGAGPRRAGAHARRPFRSDSLLSAASALSLSLLQPL